MKNSRGCTQLDKNYDADITKLHAYLSDKENPMVMEKIVRMSGTTLNAFEGKHLTEAELQAPNIPGYKNVGLLGGWGIGDTGLLVQQNGWIFNCNNEKTTFPNIALKYLYFKDSYN